MKQILIVDDDLIQLDILIQAFQPHADDIKVHSAINGEDGVRIINNRDIDLILTDLIMPVMDGFELISYVSKLFPEIPVLIMTSHEFPDFGERIDVFDSSRYFKKPLKVKALTNYILKELKVELKSKIWGISLVPFVWLLNLEQKTCTLTVKAKNRTGQLFFTKGDLITAEGEGLHDDEAAIEIISWEKPEIEITNVNKKKKKNIKQHIKGILMNALNVQEKKKTGEGRRCKIVIKSRKKKVPNA